MNSQHVIVTAKVKERLVICTSDDCMLKRSGANKTIKNKVNDISKYNGINLMIMEDGVVRNGLWI